MTLMKRLGLIFGLGVILGSGPAFADDVVDLGVMPGSSITIRGARYLFGQDPPILSQNVLITDDGTGGGVVSVSQSDIRFPPTDVDLPYGIVGHFELRAQSDLVGTYDRNTGSFTATGDFDIKITSNAPGFNNTTCIIPPARMNLSTDTPNGSAFFGGDGTAADNTFILTAIPLGACGSWLGIYNYASIINQSVGLPSLTPGDNRLALALSIDPLLAPYSIITSLAGNGVAGFGGDGGPAADASLNIPGGVAMDGSGNVFIADYGNHRIRRVDRMTGIITTVAGNGVADFSGDDGQATDASLRFPTAVAFDSSGNLFIADLNNDRIRRVDGVTGIITTAAGNGVQGFGGDGGSATIASLNRPSGLAVDSSGNLFIADTNNHRIRRVDGVTGIITTAAGNGVPGFSGDGGPAAAASLSFPFAVAVDGPGNVFIADFINHRIRRVNQETGIITSVAGNGVQGFGGDAGSANLARLSYPAGVAVDGSGNIFIADYGNQRIRRVDAATNIIGTSAGNGVQGFSGDGGPSSRARLNSPVGVAVDPSGTLVIADQNNHRIRLVVP